MVLRLYNSTCPNNEVNKCSVISSIMDLDSDIKSAFEEKIHDVFNWLIGKEIPNINRDLLQDVVNIRK